MALAGPAAMATSTLNAQIARRGSRPWMATSRGLLLLPLRVPSRRTHFSFARNPAMLLTLRVIGAQSSSSSAQSETTVDAEGETERARKCLQDLAETLVLPPGFLSKLPDGLKVDLKDAAFALSSGQIKQECGEKVGQVVMDLSHAWEQADTQTATNLARKVPSLQDLLPSDPVSNAALGRRLEAAGRFLALTGQYGDGELQKLSKALLAAGEALSLSDPNPGDKAPPEESARIFKFGDWQVQLNSQNAYIGAAIAFVFGILCWELTSGFQNAAVSPSQYANDNSNVPAVSLRGTVLAAGYFCTVLSAVSMAGLIVLGTQWGPKDTS